MLQLSSSLSSLLLLLSLACNDKMMMLWCWCQCECDNESHSNEKHLTVLMRQYLVTMIKRFSLTSLASSKDSLYNSNSMWYLEWTIFATTQPKATHLLSASQPKTNAKVKVVMETKKKVKVVKNKWKWSNKQSQANNKLLLSQPVQLLPLMCIHCPQGFHLCPSINLIK